MNEGSRKVLLVQAAALLFTLGAVTLTVYHFGMQELRDRPAAELRTSGFRRALAGAAAYLHRLRGLGESAGRAVASAIVRAAPGKLEQFLASALGAGAAEEAEAAGAGQTAFSALEADRALRQAASEPMPHTGRREPLRDQAAAPAQAAGGDKDGGPIRGAGRGPAGGGAGPGPGHERSPRAAQAWERSGATRTGGPNARGPEPGGLPGGKAAEMRGGGEAGPLDSAMDSMRSGLQKNFESQASVSAAPIREAGPGIAVSTAAPAEAAADKAALDAINGEGPGIRSGETRTAWLFRRNRRNKETERSDPSSPGPAAPPSYSTGAILSKDGEMRDPREFESLSDERKAALDAELNARMTAAVQRYGDVGYQEWRNCSETPKFCEDNKIAVKYLYVEFANWKSVNIGLTYKLDRWRYVAFAPAEPTGVRH